MNAVDTNVFVYSFDADEPVKKAKANLLIRQLLRSPSSVIVPWQVTGELLACLRRWQAKGKISQSNVEICLTGVISSFSIASTTTGIITISLSLSNRYSLSHWDSMLLAACIESGVDTLYSEDLSANTTYDTVTVINPFT